MPTGRTIEVKTIRHPFTDLPQVLVSDECEHEQYWTRFWDWDDGYVSEIVTALDEFKASVPAPSCETLHGPEEPKGSMRDFFRSLIRKPRSEWDEEDRQREADAKDHEVINHEL